MCEPTTIGMLAMAALSAAASMTQASMQQKQQNDVADAEREAASMAARSDRDQLAVRQQQVSEKTSMEVVDRMRQGMRERAAMRLSAGEAGIAGISPIREQASSMLNQAWDTGILAENNQNALMAINAQREDVDATEKGRYNVANAKSVDPFMGGLMIGAAGVQGAAQGASMGKSMGGSFTSGNAPAPTTLTPTVPPKTSNYTVLT